MAATTEMLNDQSWSSICWGVCEGIAGAPRFVEIPRVYPTERRARSELEVVMLLSRMTHGDSIAEATSWYLQTAETGSVEHDGNPLFLGYDLVDGTRYTVAGGWRDDRQTAHWLRFVGEL